MPKLSEAEKAKLENIASSNDSLLAKRAMILLMNDADVQPGHIAKEVEFTPQTVKRWLREFEKEGISLFPDQPNGEAGLPPPVASEVESAEPAPVEAAEASTSEAEAQARPTVRKVDLQPTDSFAEAGRKILRFHFERMVKAETGTKAGKEIERLHEMRVATRRMRAAFQVFGQMYIKKKIKPLRAGLKETGQVLGSVRDLDVFIESLQQYQQTLPEGNQGSFQAALEVWAKKRRKAQKQMVVYLDSKKYAHFKQELKKFVETEGQGVKSLPEEMPSPYQLRHLAASLIYEAYEQVRAYETVLENAPMETLHQLRISFKRFRYLLEFLREILGEEAQIVLKEVKAMQDHLGKLQDAEVANKMLKDFVGETERLNGSEPEETRVEPLAEYRKMRGDEHQQLLVSFPQAWAHFNRTEIRQALARAVSVL
jgi:CHAD domain-containing protein